MRTGYLKSQIFIGVVEDNQDPKKLGRCRCRVLNLFDDLETDSLPWASPWKDLNGNQFIVPEKGKVVTIVFDEGNIYKPEYIYAEHYNINLEISAGNELQLWMPIKQANEKNSNKGQNSLFILGQRQKIAVFIFRFEK